MNTSNDSRIKKIELKDFQYIADHTSGDDRAWLSTSIIKTARRCALAIDDIDRVVWPHPLLGLK